MIKGFAWRFAPAGLALGLVACGGSSPTGPSAAGKAVLRGVAVQTGAGIASRGDASILSSSSRKVTVRVKEKIEVTTTVSLSGTFELDDVPLGAFHVEFVDANGVVVSTVTISDVHDGSVINLQVEIKVEVTITTVVVIKIEVDGIEEHDNEHHDHEGEDD